MTAPAAPQQWRGRWVGVAETARRLGVTRQRVLALISEGKLPAQRDDTHRPARWWVSEQTIARHERRRQAPAGHWTIQQVAEFHGVDARTVSDWITSGRLAALDQGGRRWVAEAAAVHFKRPQAGRPRADAPHWPLRCPQCDDPADPATEGQALHQGVS